MKIMKRLRRRQWEVSRGCTGPGWIPQLADLLADGWEPFGVDDQWVYVRRLKKDR